MHKNFKNIDKVTYGSGAFAQLAETVEPLRKENKNYFVYVVDNYFKGKDLSKKLQNKTEHVPLLHADHSCRSKSFQDLRGRHHIKSVVAYILQTPIEGQVDNSI